MIILLEKTCSKDGFPRIHCDVHFQEEADGMIKKASKIVASVVAGRNSAFSGQIFCCLS